jgi:MSHA biogenesis protein MshI
MKMPPRFALPVREREWNAIELAADGRWIAASVNALSGGKKPRVVACATSSAVAMGTQAVQEIAAKLPKVRWSTVLSRGDYQMLVVPEPPVLDAEVQSSLRWSLASMVDFPIAESALAWMRIPTSQFDPVAAKQVYAVVARQAIVAERAAVFKKAGIALRAVDVRETALRNIASLASRDGAGLGLLSLSSSGVSTVFTYRGELYLDRFIAQPLDEIASDEQRRKRFLERLTSQLAQSLELMARSYPFFSVSRLLIAPSDPDFGLVSYLGDVLTVPVEKLDLASVFDLGAVPELSNSKAQATYLVALGAALRGLK